MKILVTGANGYLGQGVVNCLLDRGCDVVATDRCTEGVDARAQRVDCDLFTVSNPYEFFERPDVLVHMAWRDGFVHYSSAHIDDLPRHYAFMHSMAESGIKQISGMGSMHEVGFFEGSIKEDTPCHPVTPYGIGKNALRDLTKMLCQQYGVVFQWLRGYYIVSDSPRGSSVFSKIAAAALAGKEEFPFTMGQNQYDFLEYDEFCRQVTAAVCQQKINGIINICSGSPEKLADRAERFIYENHYSLKLLYGAFPDRLYDSKAIWGDNEKIQKIVKMEE